VSADLRLGDWRDTMPGVEADVLCCDPPFSARVHSGQRTGSSTRKTMLHYDAITEGDAHDLVTSWAPRTRWWALIFSDHTAQRWWESAWQAAGWYVFAPVIWLRECPTPRMSGDGPTSACDYITVARPRHRMPTERMGSRPGSYVSPHTNGLGFSRESKHPGSKSLIAMRALLRDYALRGDMIADPYAGSATTLLAASIEGMESVGSEVSPDTYAMAKRRIGAGFTPAFDFEEAAQ